MLELLVLSGRLPGKTLVPQENSATRAGVLSLQWGRGWLRESYGRREIAITGNTHGRNREGACQGKKNWSH